MSAISTILTRLRAAIWAIDVRDDIANAIEQCYSDVSNPTLKTEALEAALQNKIDEGEMAALTIGDGTITAAKLASGVIDNTLATSGAAADAKKTGDEIAAVKADLGDQVGVYNRIKDHYISLQTDPVDLTPLSSGAGLAYSIIECAEGDIFVVNATGGYGASRAWAFIDSSNTRLSVADANTPAENLELTAPTGAVKLIINDKGGGISYKVGNNLVSEVYNQKGLSPEIVNVLLSCLYHAYSDDEFWMQYLNRLKRMLNTVKYHWKSTDSDAVVMNGLFNGFTVDGNMQVKYSENTKRAVFGATHGEMPVFNSDGVTLSNYYPILIPEDAKTITITKTDSSFDIAAGARRYTGKENEMLFIGDTGWKNDNVLTYPVPVHITRGRANIMWVHLKKTDNSAFSAMPVIDILFE